MNLRMLHPSEKGLGQRASTAQRTWWGIADFSSFDRHVHLLLTSDRSNIIVLS